MSAINEIATLIANIALALSLIVALVFGIAQVKAAARDRRERLTLEVLRSFSTNEFAAFMYRINSGTLPATGDELRALPAEEQIPFIQFAQGMESLGILVSDGLINLDLVEKTLGSFVTTAWGKYQPVFLDMRVKTDDPFLGEYFQWLAELLDKRMRDNPRPPAYRAGKSV
jgi:hypothetical protein